DAVRPGRHLAHRQRPDGAFGLDGDGDVVGRRRHFERLDLGVEAAAAAVAGAWAGDGADGAVDADVGSGSGGGATGAGDAGDEAADGDDDEVRGCRDGRDDERTTKHEPCSHTEMTSTTPHDAN